MRMIKIVSSISLEFLLLQRDSLKRDMTKRLARVKECFSFARCIDESNEKSDDGEV